MYIIIVLSYLFNDLYLYGLSTVMDAGLASSSSIKWFIHTNIYVHVLVDEYGKRSVLLVASASSNMAKLTLVYHCIHRVPRGPYHDASLSSIHTRRKSSCKLTL